MLLKYMDEENLDVMGITEGWLDNRSIEGLKKKPGIAGKYEVVSCNATSQGCQVGRGSLILIKRALFAHNQGTWRIPGRAVASLLKFKNVKLALVCLYAPTDPDSAGADETAQIAKELHQYLRQIQGNGYEIILMGDLNCCLGDQDREGERGSNPS